MVLCKGSRSGFMNTICDTGKGFLNTLQNNMAPREAQRTEPVSVSTPTTPEIDNISIITRTLADDILKCAVAKKNDSKLPTCNDDYCRTMRRTVEEMSSRHEIVFTSMMTKLNITPATCRSAFKNIADEIFMDGGRNWGRIVTLYAFGARLAQYWVDKQMENHTDEIANVVSDYVEHNLHDWIMKQPGHWDAFVEYFPEPNKLEDKMRKGLMWTAAFGLGALGILAAVR